MSFHPNSIIPEVARARVVTECAQCGERLFVPERSEHLVIAACAIYGNAKTAATPSRPPFRMQRLRRSEGALG